MQTQATIERHNATGMWLAGLPAPNPQPPLDGSRSADVVIVGGGYSGMWAAWWASRLAPGAKVVILESEVCGHGPSGRNGGFVESLWPRLPSLREMFGDARALELARAADRAVGDVGGFCEAEGVDAHFNRAGYMQVSTAPAWDGAWEEAVEACSELGEPGAALALSPGEVASRCASPHLRGGAFYPGFATVDPARLALGLRERLLRAGVEIHEHSPVRRLTSDRRGGVEAETPSGSVRAGTGILALGGALGASKPWRRRLTLTSSHIVATEPVPDVLDELGWRGGECVTDFRTMVHYFRTTADDRIVFGWGGGRVVPGARTGGRAEVDPVVIRAVASTLLEFFPSLRGRRLAHAWGGPIDVSPAHVPQVTVSADERVCAAFGFTGNGVGPTCLLGRITASIALGRRDEVTRLAVVDAPPELVPPEPFRYAGGTVVRAALMRLEDDTEHGRDPGRLTRLIAGLPERLGIRVGR